MTCLQQPVGPMLLLLLLLTPTAVPLTLPSIPHSPLSTNTTLSYPGLLHSRFGAAVSLSSCCIPTCLPACLLHLPFSYTKLPSLPPVLPAEHTLCCTFFLLTSATSLFPLGSGSVSLVNWTTIFLLHRHWLASHFPSLHTQYSCISPLPGFLHRLQRSF